MSEAAEYDVTGEQSLMTKVADLYYRRRLTQQGIADRLGLSRPAVSRLLQRSRREGIVRIEITVPDGAHHRLEADLEERFGLREAIVVSERSTSSAAGRRALGAAAAGCLDRVLTGGECVGISWGTTLAAVIDHVRPRRLRTTVLPLAGGLGQAAPHIHANELAWRLAAAHEGRARLLHAPAIVAHSGIRTALWSDPAIRRVLERASHAQVALVGIGALMPSSTLIRSGHLSAAEVAALRRRGAVGDICTRPFTAAGAEAGGALEGRIVAIDLTALREIPVVIGVAGGPEKTDAILGALTGHLITVLVTDDVTARAVLARQRLQAPDPARRAGGRR